MILARRAIVVNMIKGRRDGCKSYEEALVLESDEELKILRILVFWCERSSVSGREDAERGVMR